MTSARTAPKAGRAPATTLPVARLMVDVPLPHLDRPFDYLVPSDLDDQVQPGSRVRVRFAGRLVDGFVLDRTAGSEHDGGLAYVERVVGSVAVLTPQTTALFRAVADRWAGNFVDVVRLGVPPRHAAAERAAAEKAATEQAVTEQAGTAQAGTAQAGTAQAGTAQAGTAQASTPRAGTEQVATEQAATAQAAAEPAVAEPAVAEPAGTEQTAAEQTAAAKTAAEGAEQAGGPSAPQPVPAPSGSGLDRYRAGAAFRSAVAAGRPARAAWSALPGEDWAARFAEVAATALAAGRGSVLLAPDARDLTRLDAAVSAILGPGRHVVLAADLGPSARYRRWLAVRRGDVRVVLGTRSAVYAPVADLGLLALWDDGDDLYAEPRAPYAHARDVLVLRSAQTGAALLLGGHARTAEAQLLVESGWAHAIEADRAVLRGAAPRVRAVADDVEVARDPAAATARLPSLALRTARDSLAQGRPVLVQVPRRGYAPALACARDRTPARCPVCNGPIASPGPRRVPACRWCGRPAGDWRCPECDGTDLRAVVVGAGRTAEELGRAFPGVPVVAANADHPVAEVAGQAALVVATPGAEPSCPDGYGAALLLDGWALLSRPDLRAAEETLRRWANAAALVRAGAPVIVAADAGLPAVQALVRWDPAGYAARELAERSELGFPPATRMAALTGSSTALAELGAAAELPPGALTAGPVPVANAGTEQERLLIRVPRSDGAALARALKVAAAGRSARRSAEPVRIELDPIQLG